MVTDAKLWYLQNMSLFRDLPKEDLMFLEQNSKMKVLTKGQHVYFPDEPSDAVYFLKTGRVKIGAFSDDGKEILKAILQGGEVFGLMSIIDEGRRTDFAQVLEEDTMLCVMPKDKLMEMMKMNIDLSIRITKLIGLRFMRVERKVESLIFKDARSRIIDFIKDLAEEYGRPVGHEIAVKHKLTHQDIANLTATSRQTVTTVLNELKEQDLIYLERKNMLIRDLTKLA